MFVFKKVKTRLFFVLTFEDPQNLVVFFLVKWEKKTFYAKTIQSQSPISFRKYLPTSDQEFL